ncbi:MAG: hypothetical protein AAB400_03865 [Patescibacteria group bacterium]
MRIKPLRKDLEENIALHSLKCKWDKAKKFFEANLNHPSLKTEILEPRWRGIYSFRLDRKYRALFFIKDGEVEVFSITNHYKK